MRQEYVQGIKRALQSLSNYHIRNIQLPPTLHRFHRLYWKDTCFHATSVRINDINIIFCYFWLISIIYWFVTFCSFIVYKANKDEEFLHFGKPSCCSWPDLYRHCQGWKVFLDSFWWKTIPICCDTEAWKRTWRWISKLHSCKASSIKRCINYPSNENCTKSCHVGIYRYFAFFSIQGDIGPEKLQINFLIFCCLYVGFCRKSWHHSFIVGKCWFLTVFSDIVGFRWIFFGVGFVWNNSAWIFLRYCTILLEILKPLFKYCWIL